MNWMKRGCRAVSIMAFMLTIFYTCTTALNGCAQETYTVIDRGTEAYIGLVIDSGSEIHADFRLFFVPIFNGPPEPPTSYKGTRLFFNANTDGMAPVMFLMFVILSLLISAGLAERLIVWKQKKDGKKRPIKREILIAN